MKIKFGTRIRKINKRNIWRIVYVVVAKYLPRSCYSVICLRIRAWVAKHVVLYMGKNVNIEKNVTFGSELCIGDNSTIGFNSDLYGPVEIGSNVLIGPELVVFTNGHQYDRNDVPINEQGDTPHEKVVIEDNVWIGRRVIILPGVVP